MLNQAVLVGRITGEPEVKETESGKKVTNLTLAVPRSYKWKWRIWYWFYKLFFMEFHCRECLSILS